MGCPTTGNGRYVKRLDLNVWIITEKNVIKSIIIACKYLYVILFLIFRCTDANVFKKEGWFSN